MQSIDGSWDDISLVTSTVGSEVEEMLRKELNVVIGITYLIAGWIEKHHPEKQFSLVAKKGRKYVERYGQNKQRLAQLYDKYIS